MNRLSLNTVTLIVICNMVLCFDFTMFQSQLFAQGVSVNINPDKEQYLIGEHVEANIIASADRMTQIVWPEFRDTISERLFLLNSLPIDTIKEPDGIYYYNKKLIISAYEPGIYQLNPITLFIPSSENQFQSISTPVLTISFTTPEIDEKEEIKGIKNILNIPFGKYDLIRLISLIILVSITALLLVKYIRKRKIDSYEKQKFTVDSNSGLSAWQTALREFEVLRNIEVSSAKDVKRYYTYLTDILRKYLRDEMGINAPELTTCQTIHQLRKDNETKGELIGSLETILHLADMVKFAKRIPDENMHRTVLDDAINFVVNTAPEHVNSNNSKVT